MMKKHKVDARPGLMLELNRVRQESLAASRKNDFRTVARLTGEAAWLDRLLSAAEGTSVTSLLHFSERLFTSDNSAPETPAATPVENAQLIGG